MKLSKNDSVFSMKVTKVHTKDPQGVLVSAATTDAGKKSLRLQFTDREFLRKVSRSESLLVFTDETVENIYKVLKKHFEG